MKAKVLLYAATVAIMSTACAREAEETDLLDTGLKVELSATWASDDNSHSRTAIQEDGTSIWWTTGEKINAFFGTVAAGKFTSTNTEPAESATFSGTLNAFIGNIESVVQENACWAVYPYDAVNTCDGESVTLTVSSEQVATEGTFADKFFPAVARAKTFSLSFWNVCGGVRFSVVQEGVQKVIFKSNDGSPMSGKVRVGFGDDNKPQLLEILDPVDSVVVSAPEGGFIPGTNYFAAMLPQRHKTGIEYHLRTSNQKAIKSLDNSITVHRSTFGILDKMDEGLEYQVDESPINPDIYKIIEFADARIKSSCIAAFDTDGDGELSYAEAASVTDISTAFSSTLYTSFDEFRFFTGITNIPQNWFKDRARLKSIAFPPSLDQIGDDAFAGCNGLVIVKISDIDSWVNLAYGNEGSAPFNASGAGQLYLEDDELTSFEIPSSCSALTQYVFLNCSGITDVVIPESCDMIKESAFKGCANLSSLTLYGNSKHFEKDVFLGCSALLRINLQDIDSWLSIRYDDSMSAPFSQSQSGHLYIGEKEISTAIIPPSITEIPSYAFSGCIGLVALTLHEDVIAMGTGAFTGCSSLKTINIQNVAPWAKISYEDLSAMPFNASNEGHLYVNGEEILDVHIPENVSRLNCYAFFNCSGITSMSFPSSLAIIDDDAFGGCKSLTKILIPNLSKWLSLQFKNKGSAPFNASGKGKLFYSSGAELTSPVIPENTIHLGPFAFYNCKGLNKIILEPTTPPELGDDALYGTQCFLFVWEECLDAYRTAWSHYYGRIVSEPEDLPEEAVDLGLSVKWASCNLGTVFYWEAGDYYAWGETEPKTEYECTTYKWANGWQAYTKYCDDAKYGYMGFMDNKTVLEVEDDAAVINLGGKWRIPSMKELEELKDNCSIEEVTIKNVLGLKFTSKRDGFTNKSLFLPYAGWMYQEQLSNQSSRGMYWCNSIKDYPSRAGLLRLDHMIGDCYINGLGREYGASIRPVQDY